QIAVALALIDTAACKHHSPQQPRPPYNLEFPVSFYLRDAQAMRAEPVNTVVLDMATRKEYSCFNYEISAQVDQNPSRVSVDFQGITIGDICFTAFGPATKRAPLALGPGTYALQFHDGAETDTYTVVVTPSEIRVDPVRGQFTECSHPVLPRSGS